MRFTALVCALTLLAAPAQAQESDDPLYQALDAYALYQSDVTAIIAAEISSGADINIALELAARHDPAQVARGWIAYGAVTAAQSPAFVAGVRSRVRAAGRAPVIRQLRRDAGYARRRPPGSSEAIQLILAASAADGARMVAAGHRYSGVGDSLDTGSEGADAGLRDLRTGRLRASGDIARELDESYIPRLHIGPLEAAPLTSAEAFGGPRFWDALDNRASPEPPPLPWAEASGAAPITNRMLTIAGLLIVDATESQSARVEAMLDEPRTRECLALQQLQFRQCASVAHYPNEDAHCLARHGLTMAGQCFAAIAAAP